MGVFSSLSLILKKLSISREREDDFAPSWISFLFFRPFFIANYFAVFLGLAFQRELHSLLFLNLQPKSSKFLYKLAPSSPTVYYGSMVHKEHPFYYGSQRAVPGIELVLQSELVKWRIQSRNRWYK